MQIISADERLREKRGAKVVLLGPPGVGKTSLLRTLNPERTLFGDAEAGDLCVIDWPVPTVRIDDWPTARDLACRIAGPNKSFPETMCYSQTHYDGIGGALPDLDHYDTVFIDSITTLTRLSYRHAEQQRESYSERTGKGYSRDLWPACQRDVVVFESFAARARKEHRFCWGARAGG
jgi:hypothetical protein